MNVFYKAKKCISVAVCFAIVLAPMLIGSLFLPTVSATGYSAMDFEGSTYTTFYNSSSAFRSRENSAKAELAAGGVGRNSATAMRLYYTNNATTESFPWRAGFSLYKAGDPSNAYRASLIPGKYYKVSMWVKVESLPIDADILLEIARDSYSDGEPNQGRSVIRAIKRLSSTAVPGDWFQVSGIVKQDSTFTGTIPYIVIGLDVVDHSNRNGTSVLIDDVVVEEADSAPVTVTLEPNGGQLLQTVQTGVNTMTTSTKPLTAIYGNAGDLLPMDTFRYGITPTKDGYAFDGWYSDEALTQPASVFPSADGTLYAKWADTSFYQNYESFAAKTYSDNNTDGVRGNGYGRTVSAEQNHTLGGGKSVKVDLFNDPNATGEYKPRTTLIFSGQHFKVDKASAYTITFWAYVTADCNFHWYLGSAAKSAITSCAVGQKNNYETSDICEEVTGGQWRKFTITDMDVTGGTYGSSDWEEIYLTLNLYTSMATATGQIFAYIDDVTVTPLVVPVTPPVGNDLEDAKYATFYGGNNNSFRTSDPNTVTQRYAELVSESGVGHGNSNSAMRLTYGRNSTAVSTDWRAGFGLTNSTVNPYGAFRTEAGKYYRVSLWYKTESLPTDAEILLEVVEGSYATGAPTIGAKLNRYVVRPLIHIAASTTAGEWTQVSGIVAGEGTHTYQPYLAVSLDMADYRQREGASVLIDDITIEEITNPVRISFNSNFGTEVGVVYGKAGDVLTFNPFRYMTPSRAASTFVGWYVDENLTMPVSEVPVSDTMLFAKWETGATFQDYESFAPNNYSATNTNGIHGNGFGREVSAEQNHTPGGGKSVKIKMNNDSLEYYGQTIVNLESMDVKWQADVSYIVTFWATAANANFAPEDSEVTWRVASAGGSLNSIGDIHSIEKQGTVNLKAGEWTQVMVRVNKVMGLSGNMFMTIGGTFFAAGSPVSSPKDEYKFTKYLYIDDVTVTPVFDMPKVIFHTEVADVSIPNQNAFVSEPFGYLPTPTMDGYLFKGWYNSVVGNICYGSDFTMPNVQNLNMYARWIAVPAAPYSLETGFEANDFNGGVQPYTNDGASDNVYVPEMTGTATWLKDAGLSSETGDGAMTMVNTNPYVNDKGKMVHAFTLVCPDGTPFIALKGVKYRLSYSYMGDGINSGNSYVFAIVSDKPANLGVGAADQILNKNFILGETDWQKSEQMFEADRTGYVYIALAARSNSNEYNSNRHVANIDNVKVEVLDSSYVSVQFKNGSSSVAVLVGQSGTQIPLPVRPIKTGQVFTAWYTDQALTQQYTSWNYPSTDIVLYAGFASADFSDGASNFFEPIHLSFEETDILKTWLWSPNHMEWSENAMSYVVNDSANAHTGNNYILFNAVSNHWSNRYLMFYDPTSKYNVLYLDPQSTYKVSYWYKVQDDFTGVQIDLNFNSPTNATSNIVKVASYSCSPDELVMGRWIQVEHVIETGDARVSLSLSTVNAMFEFALDDIAVQKSNEVTVMFNTNGGSEIDPVTVMTGFTMTPPDEPYKDGFVFAGWYSNIDLTQSFDFERTEVADALTLYAMWTVEPQTSSSDSQNETLGSYGSNSIGGSNEESEKFDTGECPDITDADAIVDNGTKPQDENTQKRFPWLIAAIVVGGLILFLVLYKKRKSDGHGKPEYTKGEK